MRSMRQEKEVLVSTVLDINNFKIYETMSLMRQGNGRLLRNIGDNSLTEEVKGVLSYFKFLFVLEYPSEMFCVTV